MGSIPTSGLRNKIFYAQTITIKSFAKDLKEGEQMIGKIQNAKSIKIIGKSTKNHKNH